MNNDQKLLEEAYDDMTRRLNEAAVPKWKSFDWNKWLSELNHTVNPDGTIDVKGHVQIPGRKGLRKFPFKFGKVTGGFYCHNNPLETLEGAPHTVEGQFCCTGSYIKTLEGGPTYVGETLNCAANLLESLKGAPTFVGGDFVCNFNHLKSLEGAPHEVGGNFDCSHNDELQSLKGLPKATKYFVEPFTQADVQKELERQDLDKHMSPTAKAAWGSDVFADL